MTNFSSMMRQSSFINGACFGADYDKVINVSDPATSKVIGTVPNCCSAETNRTIIAASDAFKSYSYADLSFRVKLLQDLCDVLMDHQKTRAKMPTAEQGEPLAKAHDEIVIWVAYVHTQDLGRIFRINESLEYGLFGINSGLITMVEATFGSMKESSLGVGGGSQGLDDYQELKYTCIAGLNT